MINLSFRLVRVKPLLILFLSGVLSSSARADDLCQGPFFWQTKAELYKSMQMSNEVIVSVINVNGEWQFKGAGIVKAPKLFTFERAKDLSALSKVKEHISDLWISKDQRSAEMTVRILGHRRKIKVKTELRTCDEKSVMDFEIIEGEMKGLKGLLFVKDVERRTLESEVGLVAKYNGKLGPMPDFLMKLGLEGMMRHVAISIRTLLEKDYKNKD